MRINLHKLRRFLATTLLILLVVTTTACSTSTTATLPSPTLDRTEAYSQLEKFLLYLL